VTKSRVALDFSVDGDLKFLAHQEVLRMFARACNRARIPVRTTEGFNPHPRISLPLPRPVGVASDAERVVIELAASMAPERARTLLAPQLPEGIRMHRARMLDPHERCIPAQVRYRAALVQTTPEVRARLEERIAALTDFAPVYYDRYVHRKDASATIDLRPYIESLSATEECVEFTLHVTGGGTAKPAEICDVLGLGGANVNHWIRRTAIVWRQHH
jgi:radical SAM-linked protein